MTDPRHLPLPDHLKASLTAYTKEHRPVGGFLEACISNNLVLAVALADAENIHLIPAVMIWLHNEAEPAFCWGSPGAYQRWLAWGDKEASS